MFSECLYVLFQLYAVGELLLPLISIMALLPKAIIFFDRSFLYVLSKMNSRELFKNDMLVIGSLVFWSDAGHVHSWLYLEWSSWIQPESDKKVPQV